MGGEEEEFEDQRRMSNNKCRKTEHVNHHDILEFLTVEREMDKFFQGGVYKSHLFSGIRTYTEKGEMDDSEHFYMDLSEYMGEQNPLVIIQRVKSWLENND